MRLFGNFSAPQWRGHSCANLRDLVQGDLKARRESQMTPPRSFLLASVRGLQPVASLAPASLCASPQTADRRARSSEGTDAAMSDAALHAARIVGPLHGVNGGIETRADEIAKMLPPTLFDLHGRLQWMHTPNAVSSQAVPDASVLEDRPCSAGV